MNYKLHFYFLSCLLLANTSYAFTIKAEVALADGTEKTFLASIEKGLHIPVGAGYWACSLTKIEKNKLETKSAIGEGEFVHFGCFPSSESAKNNVHMIDITHICSSLFPSQPITVIQLIELNKSDKKKSQTHTVTIHCAQ